jgi:sialate O-acetylesterase
MMKKMWLVLMSMGMTLSVYSDVTLHGLFTDHMVLQREIPVAIYGKADPSEKVIVAFAGQEKTAITDKAGNWSVKLDALKASTNSATLSIAGKNKVTLKDVVVGDVWVCSGQSNMELLLGSCGSSADAKKADYPLIRQFDVPSNYAGFQQTEVKGSWVSCTLQTAGNFTAVGYYFGRKIHRETGIPIGLIRSVASGRSIEPFCSADGLAAIPELSKNKARLDVSGGCAIGPCDWHCMYNGMIHPLVTFGIKGVLFYQGETNGSEEDGYYHKMRALINGWRKAWSQGDFPFHFVQLPNYSNPDNKPEGGDGWAKTRMGQFKALSITNTGMAVTIELANVGNPGDVHPQNKRDVGERLALWALAKNYGKNDLVYSGPLYRAMNIEDNKIRIAFDNIGSGLTVATKKGYNPMVKDPQGKLQRFAIAGDNKKWFWADAVIDGKTIVVSSPEVLRPVAVRYAYSVNPDGCNLYNNEGLPASPFRTDAW